MPTEIVKSLAREFNPIGHSLTVKPPCTSPEEGIMEVMLELASDTFSSKDTVLDPLDALTVKVSVVVALTKSSTTYRKLLDCPASNNVVETMVTLKDCHRSTIALTETYTFEDVKGLML